ncbi:MAG TPA: right-handed parallel beta-helix repeat-containing protein [Longimicrobiaceae bacterium]|nr:right-handed parallel beta-helix repeat-containing protein [Longimicrobiaceae bacterium]
MSARVDNFIIRDADGVRTANSLVLGRGFRITETASGIPELEGTVVGEVQLTPSDGDDTQAIQAALATGRNVRLGPGTFTLTATLTLGAGGSGQRLVGSGNTQTLISFTAAGIPAIDIVSGHSGVESLRVAGVYNSGQTGIRAVFPSPSGPVLLRDLAIGSMETGIHLEKVAGCEVAGVDVSLSSLYGIYAREITRAALRNIAIHYADTTGIHIENGREVTCESIHVDEGFAYGIFLSGGAGYRLAGVYAVLCETAVAITGTTGATVAESLILANCTNGILVDQARGVALNGCELVWARESLVILDSENVVAGALRSDTTGGSFGWRRHVRVASSAGVFVTGMRVAGSGTVDVSAAGNRVLFGPNNFPPGSIVSGGNFAAL